MTPKNLAAAAVLALSAFGLVAAPAHALGDKGSRTIVIGDDVDFLERLVSLDAEDIAELREDIADARYEIDEAIAEIDEARAELAGVPGGGIILKIAFGAARQTTSAVVSDVMRDLRGKIDDAEAELSRSNYSSAEKRETADAIDALRDELDLLELALRDLSDTFKS